MFVLGYKIIVNGNLASVQEANLPLYVGSLSNDTVLAVKDLALPC